MVYITGDTHGDFSRLCRMSKTKDDIVIILGDVGINYYLNNRDEEVKKLLNLYKVKLFCIQGNHEERPENLSNYKKTKMFGGIGFVDDKYPNLFFAKNGELYYINGKSVLVIGGAYSVDKDYRIANGYQWFKDEQLSEEEKKDILNKYCGKHIDIILSHTCPLKYVPEEAFMSFIDQTKVDKSMEIFLNKVEESIDYDKWYCGHWHIEKEIEKLEFMFGRVKDLETGEYNPMYDHLYGYEIIRDFVSSNDTFKEEGTFCPICKSKNIIIEKGDGEYINGFDALAVVCHDCKKVYGFNDVKYKSNCPKEL